jgi:hypothetical protein
VDDQLLQPYCEFLKLLGHHVIQTGAVLWVDVRPGIFQPAASFHFHPVTKSDLAGVLRHRKLIACRWFSNGQTASAASTISGPSVYNARAPYDLDSMHQKARNQTRKGLEKVSIKRVVLTESLEPQCFRVYTDNVKRLGLFRKESQIQRRWKRWVAAIRNGACAELWTAWSGPDLLAFTVAVRTPWGTELVLQRSAREGLSLCPNNVLVYEVARDAFRRGSDVVSFGLSSFSAANSGLDHFKENMGFRSVQLAEHYSWNPLLRPLVPLLTSERLRNMHRLVLSSIS